MTIQRRVVLEALDGRTDHPTVETLFEEVKERLPGTSKATIYRSLETLCQFGLVRRVAHPFSAVRFDPNVEHHHHFICDECGCIEDVPAEEVSGELPEWSDRGDLSVHETSLVFRGYCQGCAAKVC